MKGGPEPKTPGSRRRRRQWGGVWGGGVPSPEILKKILVQCVQKILAFRPKGGASPSGPLNTPLNRNIGSRTRSDLSKHDQSLSEEPEIKYDDPRLEMSHLGCDLVRHFQPRVHHIWMSN